MEGFDYFASLHPLLPSPSLATYHIQAQDGRTQVSSVTHFESSSHEFNEILLQKNKFDNFLSYVLSPPQNELK